MTTTMPWLQQLFARELRAFGDELQLFPHEAQLWQTVPGVTNAAGTLALHVSGNLQHYIGRVLGGSSYERDRPREFSARDVPRDDVLAELARASAVVQTVLPTPDDAALDAQYPEQLNGVWIPTGLFLATGALMLLLGCAPAIEIHESHLSIGDKIIGWEEVQRLDRTGAPSPLSRYLTLHNKRRLLL